MATTNYLPLTITVAALPVGWTGTPQELAEALAERIQIATQESFARFTVGATEPESDIGPWAKDGKTWYYFDSVTGAYIPFVIPQESLGYQISVEEPTADAINVWFQIDTDGLPIAIKTKSIQSGTITWTSAYYLKTETLSTGEIQLAIATQIRWAARAKPNIDQTISIDGADHKMTLNAETITSVTTFVFTKRTELMERALGLAEGQRQQQEKLNLLQRKRAELAARFTRTAREAVMRFIRSKK